MDLLAIVVTGLWAMLPAYVPNNVAVVAGGGRPIDGGATWNGRRVLGDGKTWRGTAAGVLVGAALALALNAVAGAVGTDLLPAPFPPLAVVSLPAGAMVGDVVASALKRRLGRERGAPVPLLDQLDLVVGALVVTVLAAPAWSLGTFTVPVLAVVLVLTPLLHVGTNRIGYELGITDEPW